MKTIGIIPNLAKPEVVPVAKELVDWLGKRGLKAKIPQEEADSLGRPELGFSDEELPMDVEFFIILGGDGTILRAARILDGARVPLLGVNFGKFGFLSETEASNLYGSLQKMLEGNYTLEPRAMLDATIVARSGHKEEYRALNEVVVGRTISQRIVGLDVFVNESFFVNYAADGLIFSTPTGSTAYSLSAGGPIVGTNLRLILMTPVCPHTFFDRSVVFSDRDKIKVVVSPSREMSVSIDGQLVKELALEHLEIEVSPASLNLAKVDTTNFFALVREKLGIR